MHLYIAHTQPDTQYKIELNKHLTTLKRNGNITVSSSGETSVGLNQQADTRAELAQANIILFLLSSDLLANDHFWDFELAESLQRRNVGEAVLLVPILVRPCELKNTPFNDIQRLPRDGRAVSEYDNPDQIWTAIAREITALVEHFPQTIEKARALASHQPAATPQPQWIGSKNVISGSVIIVGGDLVIGDRNE